MMQQSDINFKDTYYSGMLTSKSLLVREERAPNSVLGLLVCSHLLVKLSYIQTGDGCIGVLRAEGLFSNMQCSLIQPEGLLILTLQTREIRQIADGGCYCRVFWPQYSFADL